MARRDGISLNRTALNLLRRGVGLPEGQGDGRTIGDARDDLIGSWPQQEANEFNCALEHFESVNESEWK